jgi:hypothetical protein
LLVSFLIAVVLVIPGDHVTPVPRRVKNPGRNNSDGVAYSAVALAIMKANNIRAGSG